MARGRVEPVVLKPALRHLAGERLTDAQEVVNRHAGGHQASYYARMLCELLEADAIDWANATLVGHLRRLAELLSAALAERDAVA